MEIHIHPRGEAHTSTECQVDGWCAAEAVRQCAVLSVAQFNWTDYLFSLTSDRINQLCCHPVIYSPQCHQPFAAHESHYTIYHTYHFVHVYTQFTHIVCICKLDRANLVHDQLNWGTAALKFSENNSKSKYQRDVGVTKLREKVYNIGKCALFDTRKYITNNYYLLIWRRIQFGWNNSILAPKDERKILKI